MAKMKPCICKKFLDCTHPFTFIRCFQFPENNSDGSLRVKTISIFFLMRCHLDQRIHDISLGNHSRNHFFAVHAIHKAHHNGILTHSFPYTLQCSRQSSVFQRNNQQIYSISFLRCPHMRMVNGMINRASLFLQALRPLPFCHNAKFNIFHPGKSPDHIRAHCACSKNCH